MTMFGVGLVQGDDRAYDIIIRDAAERFLKSHAHALGAPHEHGSEREKAAALKMTTRHPDVLCCVRSVKCKN